MLEFIEIFAALVTIAYGVIVIRDHCKRGN